MSKSMDPFSGSWNSDACIPSWEKGSKKVPHWDSSDLSGISSSSSSGEEDDSSNSNTFETSFISQGDASCVVDSEDDGEQNGPAQMASVDEYHLKDETEKTPRAAAAAAIAKKHTRRDSTTSNKNGSAGYKGKAKAKNQDEVDEVEDISPTSLSSKPVSGKTRPRRPRSHSNTSNNISSPPFLSSLSPPASAESSTSTSSSYRILSKRAPGPAAQAMADFMSHPSNDDSHSRRLSQSSLKTLQSGPLSSQTLMPASALNPSSSKLGSRPLSRPAHLLQNSNRQLGRATSAPVNLFGESLPTNNLFSPGRSSLSRTEEEGAELLGTASPSPEADLHAIIIKAYETRSGSIDLSRKNLVRLPSNVSDLSHFVTLDVRTNQSHPTPINLLLDNNFLNASGLHPSLFSITNLRILSLRGNQIEALPQSIGNLKELKQLLLFNNKLTYLPAEILELKLEKLQLGSNRFPNYVKPASGTKDEDKNGKETVEEVKLDTSIKRVCDPRKKNFHIPTLLELCTRRLLEPVDGSRESGNSPSISTRSKLFTPGMSNASTGNVRRQFHTVKDRIISPRIDFTPVPPHLLKPFLPLLNPLPHHLRCLLSPARSPALSKDNVPGTPSSAHLQRASRTPGTPYSPSSTAATSISQTPFESVKEIQQCSVCKTACSEFAETRIEWRSEIAGVSLGKGDDERCWVPVLWRGCSSNCLDFLDE